jgi:ABC-type antimicrobial peptide transport system permease subunit
MALGARVSDVLTLVFKQGMTLVLIGEVMGLAGAFALTRLIRGLLFGVTPTDFTTFITVAAMLAAVALVATLIPARRAARVDPLVALRYD